MYTYTATDLRRELIREHGAKLNFLFSQFDKKGILFEVNTPRFIRLVGTDTRGREASSRFDGDTKGAYVDEGAPDLAMQRIGLLMRSAFGRVARKISLISVVNGPKPVQNANAMRLPLSEQLLIGYIFSHVARVLAALQICIRSTAIAIRSTFLTFTAGYFVTNGLPWAG